MRFRRHAPAVLIGASVLVAVVTAVVSNRLFGGMTSTVEEGQFALMRAILDDAVRNAQGKALARAEMIASLPSVREVFAARDRERLLADLEPMFKIQKERYGVDQCQFHVPPATSFLRLHDPQQYGDDLTPFRPMVVQAQRDKTNHRGFAIARSGPAIFGVVPVLDPAGQFSGTLDVGIDFGPLLDGLKAAYGVELALYIEEKPLRDFAKGVSGEVLTEQNRVGKYIRFHSTNAALMKELTLDRDLAAMTDGPYTREVFGAPWGVLLVPLQNGAGDNIGVVAAARDFSASRAATGRAKVWQALLALFTIVFSTGVILVVVRGLLLAPLAALTGRFAALARGEDPGPMPEEGQGDELQELAAQYEVLRARNGSSAS